VYFIAKRIPLSEILALFKKKYASIGYNLVHVKKSLVFFDDAENKPMPLMLVPVDWEAVKEFFVAQIVRL
jgi:hypothetical protein